MSKIITEHIVTDIKLPFWSVLKLTFKFYVSAIIVGTAIGGIILLISFFMTGAFIAIMPVLGM